MSGAISRSRRPRERTDRHTAALAGLGGVADGIAEVHVLPAQRPGLFCADAGRQARAMYARILVSSAAARSATPGPGSRLLLGRCRLAFRCIDEHGHVAPDQVPGLGVAIAGSARCGPWRRRRWSSAGPSPPAPGGRRWPSVRAAACRRWWPGSGEDVLVFLIVLGTGRAGLARASRLRRAGWCSSAGPGRLFDVAVERLEPVLDDGLGLPETLRRSACRRRRIRGHHSSPPAVAVPVAVASRQANCAQEDHLRAIRVATHGSMIARMGANPGGQLPAL